jgi:putative FmdB family regulatory protein
MPIYDYECSDCHERYEIFQRISDEPLKKCIKCNGNIKRIISGGTGLIFKGSGFYITDYKNKKISKDSEKESNKDS